MYFEFCVVREAASAEGTAKNGTALSGERGGQYRATAEKRKGRHRTPAGKRRRQHRGPAGEGEGQQGGCLLNLYVSCFGVFIVCKCG